MSVPALRIWIDWAGEGVFQPAFALTGRVVAVRWRLGFTDESGAVAPVGTAEVTLHDRAAAEHPETRARESRPSMIGAVLVIESAAGTRLFTGFIHHIAEQAADWGEPAFTLVAFTADAAFAAAAATPPLLDVAADVAVRRALADLALRPLVWAGTWALGLPARSSLSAVMLAGSPVVPLTADAACTRFPLVGGGWGETARAWLTGVVEGEGGRLWADRDGGFRLINRHHTLRRGPPAHTFAHTAEAVYTWGEDAATQVSLTFTPRRIGPANTVLWRLGAPVRLSPGTRTMEVRFTDALGFSVAAVHVAGLSWSASTHPEGQGEERPIAGRIVAFTSSGATLEWTQPHREPVYLMASTAITGTPLYTGAPVEVTAERSASAAAIGTRPVHGTLAWVSSAAEAHDRAAFLLLVRGPVRGVVSRLTFPAASAPLAVLRLFARIAVHAGRAGHTGDYHIVGEAHDAAADRHTVTLWLEPAPPAFWALNTAALGTDARLAV
jgi:hypothetical protein